MLVVRTWLALLRDTRPIIDITRGNEFVSMSCSSVRRSGASSVRGVSVDMIGYLAGIRDCQGMIDRAFHTKLFLSCVK
jgi:hypothetical protein